ncbi:hypothetical protein [Streptomyces yokosukanensis]|uniref:hypothetical protein n=1 Tax=Streptomyces yokosukanensis TaxID=67386 RepID=UPI000A55EBB3|nr:hypothetical protein [Streptomyces yokosukanensis]
MTGSPAPDRQAPSPTPPPRRTEFGTPPEAADGNSPDGWEANHAVLAQLSEHRVGWRP